jgi:putative thioredoxin
MESVYEVKDFQQEVLEESKKRPVLVDFWASWCQPCKILGPVLEDLAQNNEDKFLFKKLNTEMFQDIAKDYKITSIPAVKLFVDGEVKAEFLGALPKRSIEKWLEEHIPSAHQKELEEIKRELSHGFNDSIRQRLAKIIYEDEKLDEARVLLAQNIIFKEADAAAEIVQPIQAFSAYFQLAEAIIDYSRFIHTKRENIEEGPFKDLLIQAIDAAKNNNFSSVFENLINILIINKAFMNEIARKTCVALFLILGADHEMTKKFRRRFDMSLY